LSLTDWQICLGLGLGLGIEGLGLGIGLGQLVLMHESLIHTHFNLINYYQE